jgi:F-box and leucine-rich repeat protein 2/20
MLKSRLFSEDWIITLVLNYLDVRSVNVLDTSISNRKDRSSWLASVRLLNMESLHEFEHSSLSLRWLILRGIQTTKIQIKTSDQSTIQNSLDGIDIPLLTFVDFSNCLHLSDNSISSLSQGCPHLKTLILRGCRLKDAAIEAVSRFCPDLTTLNIDGCIGLTAACLHYLAHGCSHLQDIDLRWMSNMTPLDLATLAKGCQDLHTVSLGSHLVTDNQLIALVTGCPHLLSLVLKVCSTITDDGLSAVCSSCLKLQSIDLYYCSLISDRGIMSLSNCQELRKINLKQCRRVTDYGMAALSSGCRNLQIMNLSDMGGFSAPSVASIAAHCHQLQHLELCRYFHLLDSSIAQCLHLETLVLCGSAVTDGCLEGLSTGCPALTALNISNCYLLTDGAVAALLKGSYQLRSLDLSLCDITDACLGTLSAGFSFRRLEELSLNGCHRLTDRGMEMMAAGPCRLKRFNLVNNNNVTDEGLRSIAEAGSALVSVNHSFCSNISSGGIQQLLSACNNIRALNISSCSLIHRASSVDAWSVSFPLVKISH